MVLDTLDNADRYAMLHPGFKTAFAWLREHDLGILEPGRQEIDGERLFAVVDVGPGLGRVDGPREAHNHYIDIQYVVSGVDDIGWIPRAQCRKVKTPYDSAKDLMLFADEPVTWCVVEPGSYAIFFPEDCHAPKGAPPTRQLRKVILKVKVAW